MCVYNNIRNNLVPNSFVLSQQEERVNSPVKNKSEPQEMVLGSACGRLSRLCTAEAHASPGDWPHPRPPSSSNHPSYLLWSVSWHRFSIAWISSRIRQPRLQKRHRNDVALCDDAFPQKRKISREPKTPQTFPAHTFLTNLLSHTVGVVAPLVVAGKHLLQHKHDAGHQSLALGTTKLSLQYTMVRGLMLFKENNLIMEI